MVGGDGDSAEAIRIHPPRVEDRGEWTRVSFAVEGLAGDPRARDLWFDVDSDYRSWVAYSCDAAVSSLLAAAMAEGRPLVTLGPLSARLHWHLHHTVMPVVVRLLPFLVPIRVVPGGEGGRGGLPGRAEGERTVERFASEARLLPWGPERGAGRANTMPAPGARPCSQGSRVEWTPFPPSWTICSPRIFPTRIG